MSLVNDEMVVITKDGEVETKDEIRVKVISPQPVIETPLNIGGIKTQIESVNSEIIMLQQSLLLLENKKTLLIALLAKVEEVTKDIILKSIEPVKELIK